MQSQSCSVLIQFEAIAGKEGALEQSLLALIEPTVKEAGCIYYHFHKSQNDPAKFMFYETWNSEEAFNNHLASKHVQSWLAIKDDLLAKPFDISLWTPRQ